MEVTRVLPHLTEAGVLQESYPFTWKHAEASSKAVLILRMTGLPEREACSCFRLIGVGVQTARAHGRQL